MVIVHEVNLHLRLVVRQFLVLVGVIKSGILSLPCFVYQAKDGAVLVLTFHQLLIQMTAVKSPNDELALGTADDWGCLVIIPRPSTLQIVGFINFITRYGTESYQG